MTDEMVAELVIVFLFGIMSGPTFALPLTPIFCLLRKMFYVPFIQKKLFQEAVDKGNVVKAKLKSSYKVMRSDLDGDRHTMPYRTAIYVYEYKRKKYKYRARAHENPPEEITLYFLKSPKRACLSREVGYTESNWLKYFFGLSILITLTVFAIGGLYVFSK